MPNIDHTRHIAFRCPVCGEQCFGPRALRGHVIQHGVCLATETWYDRCIFCGEAIKFDERDTESDWLKVVSHLSQCPKRLLLIMRYGG